MAKKIITNDKRVLVLSNLNQQLGTFLTMHEHILTWKQIELFSQLQAAICLEIVLLNNYAQRRLYISALSFFIKQVSITNETIATKETGYLLNRENLNLYNITSTIVNTYRSILEREEKLNKRKTR